MTLPLYAKISIGIISVVLIATVALVVVTIVTNKDKSPVKTSTMQELMTSSAGGWVPKGGAEPSDAPAKANKRSPIVNPDQLAQTSAEKDVKVSMPYMV